MTDPEPRNNVGDMLAKIRGERPLSEVAAAAGMDPANLWNIERHRRPIGRGALHRILSALNASADDRGSVFARWVAWGVVDDGDDERAA